jgi:hypothetical protein
MVETKGVVLMVRLDVSLSSGGRWRRHRLETDMEAGESRQHELRNVGWPQIDGGVVPADRQRILHRLESAAKARTVCSFGGVQTITSA